MARRDAVREALEELKRHALEPGTEAARDAFRTALRKGSSLVASGAARHVGEHEIKALRPELEAAFQRFLRDAPRNDPRCVAKQAIIEALDRLEHDRLEPFWIGLRLTQIEAGFGGRVDTAAALRGRCAVALARAGTPAIHRELARLLFDPWPEARAGAVAAAALAGGSEAELLLRAKLHAGDGEPAIVGDCLRALLQLAPEDGFELSVDRLLGVDEELAAQAALALGESRHPRAFEALREAWNAAIGSAERRQMLLLPIALVRSDQALDFLAEVEREGPGRLAAAAAEVVRGLGIRRDPGPEPGAPSTPRR
jgi:hypothetical protein